MSLKKRDKKVGVSFVLGVFVAMVAISVGSFADACDEAVSETNSDKDVVQYIYFGEIPKTDKYLKKVQGKEISWKVNNSSDEEKKDDVIRMSVRREKIKNKGSESEIDDCFNDKEREVLLDAKGEIIEKKEIKKIIEKVEEIKEGILDKIIRMINKHKKKEEKKEKIRTKKVEYINIDIPVANILYKSSGSSKYFEVGSFKLLSELAVSRNKLTIVDDGRKGFVVDEDEVIGKAGDIIELNYHNAALSEDQSKEYISGIIKDTYGNALYYGKFSNVLCGDDKVDIKLPENIESGEYELMVLTEQENGAKKTNYAGFDMVKLIINQ